MINKLVTYAKYYFEVKSRVVRKMAFDSAKQYYAGKSKTLIEFQAYQRGYVGAYRHAYAKTKMNTI